MERVRVGRMVPLAGGTKRGILVFQLGTTSSKHASASTGEALLALQLRGHVSSRLSRLLSSLLSRRPSCRLSHRLSRHPSCLGQFIQHMIWCTQGVFTCPRKHMLPCERPNDCGSIFLKRSLCGGISLQRYLCSGTSAAVSLCSGTSLQPSSSTFVNRTCLVPLGH